MKIGEKITLKDYSGFEDYREHDGQIATIIEVFSSPHHHHGTIFFHCRIRWKDKKTSAVVKDNIVFPNWKELLSK